jgi:hypothetical protein
MASKGGMFLRNAVAASAKTQLRRCRQFAVTQSLLGAWDPSVRRPHFGGGCNFSSSSNDGDKSKVEEDGSVAVEFEDLTAKDPEVDRSKYTEEIKVRMPDMGEGEGKILTWYKQEGDVVKRQDILCDIETPDFTFGMETDDEHLAIMGKILVPAPSEPIKDGEVICILLHEDSSSSK